MAGNSDFGALLKLRREPVAEATSDTQSPPQQQQQHSRRGKSQNPDFDRLTVYLRRDSILTLNRRKVEEGRELSDLVQEALDAWLR